MASLVGPSFHIPLSNDGCRLTPEEFLTSNLVDLVTQGIVLPSLSRHLFVPSNAVNANTLSSPLPQLLFRGDVTCFPASHHVAPLQILAMDNVLVSLADQARQQAHQPSGKRIAKIVLTDGAVSFVAIEKKRCSALDVAALGAKVKLVNDPKIRNGVVMLTDENLVVLGGAVARLVQERALWLSALAKKLTGAPSVHPTLAEQSNVPLEVVNSVQVAVPQVAASTTLAPVRASTPTLPAPSRIATSAAPPPPPLSFQPEAPVARPQSRATIAHAFAPAAPPSTLQVQACIIGICEPLSISPLTNGYSLVATLLVTQLIHGDASLIGGGEIDCDLGHPWLMELLGMRPEDFIEMSDAALRHPEMNDKVMETIHRVGKVLETYQEGIFELKAFPNASAASAEGCRALFCVLKQRRIV